MVCCKCCQGYATLCRVFTHAWLIAAVVLSSFAVGSCEFVTRDSLTIGLFRVQRPGYDCVAYSDLNDLSYGWIYDWARVCGLLAPLSGGLVVALMLLDCCCKVCCSKYMQTFLVVCCQLNQGFTFLIYASDACISRKGVESDKLLALCRMGDGSIFSFFAFMCYFIGGFFLCCSPKPDPACCKKDDDGKKCCRKDKKEDKSEDVETKSEENPAAQEDKPEEENPAVVPVAVKEEEEKEEEPDELEEAKEEENPEEARAVADEEEPEEGAVADEEAPEEEEVVPDDEEEEAPEEREAPTIVPVPIIIPAIAPRSKTPQPDESGMEMEFDEEFGTSQIRAPMY
mmetsp:Transcript_33531/g.60402  ORF Transcript_33531/g.60402 Transcript_33531/m.60402 type:complete len:341 (-) Transcript_33531:155-1177(-)